MESPIVADGIPAGSNPQGPDTKIGAIPEGHPSIHDARSAIMEQAVEEESARRVGENAASGFDVAAPPEPGSEDAPEGDDALDGVRGKEGYVPDRSMPDGRPGQPQAQTPAPEEGLQDKQPMHDPAPEPRTIPEGYESDPLAEFLMEDADTGEIFVKTVVNGQQELIPFEKAKRAIQIHESADRRLQEASRVQGQLDERERTITAREKDLQTRFEAGHTPVVEGQPSADAALSDDDLAARAKEVVTGLFTEDQDTATAKLVDLLKESRGATATPVDPEVIAQRAVTAAREQLTEEAVQKDVKKGYKKFAEDYPEIDADPALFKYADSLTDTVAAEHPDWMPSEVMLEAGKRTSEWLKGLRGETPPEPKDDPTHSDQPSDRHERKRTLRPMPRFRAGTQEAAPVQKSDTPASVLAEIRESRGQVA